MTQASKRLISVIIPTYNREKYVAEAVESVLQQKIKGWDIEVIVVDNGSTDNTVGVLKKFGHKIRLYEVPASGKPSVPRNVGIAKAKGELLAFHDSDDVWTETKLAEQVPYFDDSKIVMTYGNAEVIKADGTKTGKLVVEKSKLKDGETFNGLLKQNVISTLTVVVRKTVLEATGTFNESDGIYEDYELWLRILAASPKGVRHIPQTLAYYRYLDSSISRMSEVKNLEKIIATYEVIWELDSLADKQRQYLETAIDVMQENWSRLQSGLNNRPSISVVMSVYNGKKFLHEAIESILSQTFKDFEFIIIDDGSVDESVDIIRSYKDDRIRLIRQNNHGLVFSFNKGVRLARSEFIARMDADDISLPTRFEKEVTLLAGNKHIGLVGSFFTYIDEDTSTPLAITMTAPTKHVDLVRMMYIVNPFGHGSIMMRKSAVQGAGGYRHGYEPAEDFDLWHRIARDWTICQIPEVLYWWRLNPNSISHTKQEIQHKAAARTVSELWEQPVAGKSIKAIISDARYYRYLTSPFQETVYHQYVDLQIRLAFELLIHGHLIQGYRATIASLWLKPWAALRLWKTALWAPFKLALGRKAR